MVDWQTDVRKDFGQQFLVGQGVINPCWCQFHQRFTWEFFVQMLFWQLFLVTFWLCQKIRTKNVRV